MLSEKIQINNICSSFTLSTRLDRKTLMQYFPSINYPKKFSGGILKFREGCLLIFDSGKINVTGVKNIMSAFMLIDRFCDIYPGDLTDIEFKIVNIVSHSKLKQGYDYNKLTSFPLFSYEPELFPGMHVKVDDSKAIFIVFRTGRITLTGISDLGKIDEYFNEFIRISNEII